MKIEQSVEIDAPPEQVWDSCADPVTLAGLMGPAMVVKPAVEDQQPQEGACYRTLVKVGAALVGGDVMIVENDPPRELAWKAITGIDHRWRLRLRPAGSGRTEVTLRFGYDAPGIFGAVSDLAAYPRLSSLLHDTLEAMKHLVEEGTRPGPPAVSLLGRLVHELGNAAVLARAGIIAPVRPDRLARIALTATTRPLSVALAVTAGAIRHPDATLLIDEFGALSYLEVDKRTDAIASGLSERGIGEGDAVALMVRNHRGFIEAATAVAKIGGDVLLLNTSFAAPQICDVCDREGATALIYDAEFAGLLADAAEGRKRIIAATGDESFDDGATSLDAMVTQSAEGRPPATKRAGKVTILTSGTTGTPKGASRGAVSGGGLPTLEAPAALLDRIPMRSGMRIGLAAPMFHAWGLSNLLLGLGLGATNVLLGKFDPEAWLAEIERSGCEALIVVPVMLERILDLPEQVRSRYDTSSLRIVSVSGSALPGDLATKWMDSFGDNLYNLYGSTEVANASIATPRDLRTAPGTSGRLTRGTTVKLLDDTGAEVPQGQVGRIFVGNAQLFEGYTAGGNKDMVGGLMASGDLGRFDEAGRLFVVGRDDEMIVSGGENVFPQEVEDTITGHPAVAEAACVGVDDDEFGQRLHAFVVLREGHDASEDDLKSLVGEELARYKVPRAVTFVDELPRTSTGKVLKRELIDSNE